MVFLHRTVAHGNAYGDVHGDGHNELILKSVAAGACAVMSAATDRWIPPRSISFSWFCYFRPF